MKDQGASPQRPEQLLPEKDLVPPLRDLSDFSHRKTRPSPLSQSPRQLPPEKRPRHLPTETWVAFPRERPGCLPFRLLPGKTRASPLIQRLKGPFSEKDHRFSLQTDMGASQQAERLGHYLSEKDKACFPQTKRPRDLSPDKDFSVSLSKHHPSPKKIKVKYFW